MAFSLIIQQSFLLYLYAIIHSLQFEYFAVRKSTIVNITFILKLLVSNVVQSCTPGKSHFLSKPIFSPVE